MLVSDDPSVREALGQILCTAGLDVLEAESGRSAVTIMRANRINVIALDLRTRFDAKDTNAVTSKALTALTDMDPFLPVILTCDANAELDYETALMADLVLRHPVEASALLDGIDTLLGESLRERLHRKSHYIATLR
jgi:DNA-binding NtrC family response regulator